MSALLPADDTPWPPPSAAGRYSRMRRPAAWYAGDPDRLRETYGIKSVQTRGGVKTTLNAGGGPARVIGSTNDSFWASSPRTELDTRRHLPIAQDISTISADLLFSDPPNIRVKGPLDQDGKPTLETKAAQQRLDYVLDKCGFHPMLLAAAEIASALGSTGLRIAFDKSATAIKDRPVITKVVANAAIPHYSWGQLVGVTFWSVVNADADTNTYWRHLELHEAGTGMVYHALYKGDATSIGKRQPLTESPVTRSLAPLVGQDGGIEVVRGAVGKTATSIPNMLPDPMDLNDDAGRSDYTSAVMDLFDAADKAYTQMMDEVDDAKSRLLIADSMLERNKPGEASTFDSDQRIFRKLKVPPSEKEGAGLPIEKVQFDMRVEQYLQLIDALTHKAIDAAGFNPNTERDQQGAAMTATEYAGRNRKSMTTRDKKVRYWEGELEELLSTLALVDVQQFAPVEQIEGQSVRVQAYPVEVKFPEAVQPTISELAQTAKTLREAGESIVEIQRVLHPDWDETKLNEAAAAIQRATQVIDPLTFGAAGQGVGAGDGV